MLEVLRGVAPRLVNHRVLWFTDNVASILLVGSRKECLQALALKIFSLSIQHNIRLEPERELNQKADYLSRIVDYDDWMLNPVVASDINHLWGPHSLDRLPVT